MDTKQLHQQVQIFIKKGAYANWLPSALNDYSNRVSLLTNKEIVDLEQIYFDIHGWLRGNIGHFILRESLGKLEQSLYDDGRANYIKGHVNIGAGYNKNIDSNQFHR